MGAESHIRNCPPHVGPDILRPMLVRSPHLLQLLQLFKGCSDQSVDESTRESLALARLDTFPVALRWLANHCPAPPRFTSLV